ncbi:acetyl-CoA carboxylase carboxyltransferase subunit alpha [bacterium]|nr:acetyl-CoA carboxylase carboxyltransferase subunit alpha [bacterium]NBX72135.1 acetyl-CoA carboxylase carboxyltransferase subunit alpha [bacterium]
MQFLDFEQPIADLLGKIIELKRLSSNHSIDINTEVDRLERKANQLTQSIFHKLNCWQIVQLARHPLRPHSSDYIKELFTDFDEIHGDRVYGDDSALIAGMGSLDGLSVLILAQEKGRDTNEKIKRNFGMMHPEGYRKAKRLALLAEKFKLPIITLIDTPGAYPGIGAESRGQSEAIAQNLKLFSSLKVPVISVIIGEGCSGGALGIGVNDSLLMMQYSYFATISPEGCATILFKSAAKAAEAAQFMGITAEILLQHGIIDEIVAEPLGGAHRDYAQAAQLLKSALLKQLDYLRSFPINEMVERRYQKILSKGSHGTLS